MLHLAAPRRLQPDRSADEEERDSILHNPVPSELFACADPTEDLDRWADDGGLVVPREPA